MPLFVHKSCSFTQELQDVPNGDLKAGVLPAKEVAADGHDKSEQELAVFMNWSSRSEKSLQNKDHEDF